MILPTLPGLHAARPSALVEGVGLEPHELLREQIYSLSHLPLCQPSNILCLCCVVVIVKIRRASQQAGADEKISINLVHLCNSRCRCTVSKWKK